MNKKTFLLVIGLLFTSLFALGQEQRHRISFITELDIEDLVQYKELGVWGISYDYQFKIDQYIGAYVALNNHTQLIGIDYQSNFNLIADKLKFTLGAGLGVHFYQKTGLDGKATILTGIGGLTYNLSKPISIFANYRPKLDIPSIDVFSAADIRIGVGYRF